MLSGCHRVIHPTAKVARTHAFLLISQKSKISGQAGGLSRLNRVTSFDLKAGIWYKLELD